MSENKTEAAWRDPLSIGWQAHRGLLLLRLRWHSRSDVRPDHRGTRMGTGGAPRTISGGPAISKPHSTIIR